MAARRNNARKKAKRRRHAGARKVFRDTIAASVKDAPARAPKRAK